ncbi:MAG TPA: hypothetical protein VHQ64_14610 [Pyrinomonadaceae bacterium]|jgi:hypothetical protein|nr:hypothetical protein [Pyrinomonadaceae bacterium]
MQLQKAIIAELEGETEKNPFPVQFNPTTLRLSLTNQVEGGESEGKQVRQHIGASSTTLTLDLIFDTADEGDTENPVSVRKKTKQIERFLVPTGKGKQEKAPPRICFTWGDLVVKGVIDSLTIDFDHFAANGVPLRAKVPLSIKGQDRQKELKPSDSRSNAPVPGGSSGAGVGSGGGGGLGGGSSAGLGASAGIGLSASVGIGLGASASVGVALGGESAGEFAARVGVDPAAWRGLELGGESSLSLSAGVEVGFDANLNASSGLGVTVGVEAGTSASLEASFGLEASPSLNAVSGVGVGAQLASGFALSSAGGVRAAIESVQSARNQSAETQARAAFKTPAEALPAATSTPSATAAVAVATRSTGAPPARAEQPRPPLKQTGFPPVSAQEAAPPAPRPPRADVRASSFGFGVPLRPTTGSAADMRAESIQGDVAIKPKTRSGEPPITNDPTKPGWVALPARNLGRTANTGQSGPSHKCGCGCRH